MRPSGVVGALLGAAVAMAPNSLPRALSTQMLLLVASLVVGGLLGTGVGRVWTGTRPPGSRRATILTGVAVVVYGALVAAAVVWQSLLRAGLGVAPPGPGWVLWPAAPVVGYLAAIRTPRRAGIASATVAALVAGTVAVGAGPSTAAPAPAVAAVPAPEILSVSSRLTDGPPATWAARADDLVRRWQEVGGPDRRAVVVAVPTGSGWIDPDAVAGFARRFSGDVSVVSMQYDDIPSWRAFVTDTGAARESAIALVDALTAAIARSPEHRRPWVVLSGQSLGAIGADAARAWADSHHRPVCGTVLAGPPAGTVAVTAARRVVLANASDPVTRWSWASLVRPPRSWGGPPDLLRPPWIPLAGFVQTSVDLVGSLSFPAGHGHQYGIDQGTRAPRCGRADQRGPRAAS